MQLFGRNNLESLERIKYRFSEILNEIRRISVEKINIEEFLKQERYVLEKLKELMKELSERYKFEAFEKIIENLDKILQETPSYCNEIKYSTKKLYEIFYKIFKKNISEILIILLIYLPLHFENIHKLFYKKGIDIKWDNRWELEMLEKINPEEFEAIEDLRGLLEIEREYWSSIY